MPLSQKSSPRHKDVILNRAEKPLNWGNQINGLSFAFKGGFRPSCGGSPRCVVQLLSRPRRNVGLLDQDRLVVERLSRREVIKHMANEMGGVHLERNTSPQRDLLVEAERKLFIEASQRGGGSSIQEGLCQPRRVQRRSSGKDSVAD
jgi:hypothetical protein